MSTATDAVPVAVAPAKRPPINKYAFACALLASMNSVLLGYGTFGCSITDVHALTFSYSTTLTFSSLTDE